VFALVAFSPYKKCQLAEPTTGGLKMATFEDFVLKLMTDKNFANDFLSPTSTAAKRKADLTAMGFSPAAIGAAEAVFGSPGFANNMQTLMTDMTLAGAGATARN
jgi:hypothetical protein